MNENFKAPMKPSNEERISILAGNNAKNGSKKNSLIS